MAETTNFRFEKKIVEIFDIKYRSIADNLNVFGIWKTSRTIGEVHTNEKATLIKQGFVDDANLERLKSQDLNVSTYVPCAETKYRKFFPALISAEGIERIRQEGHPFETRDLWKELNSTGMVETFPATDFVAAFENGWTIDNLYFLSISDHSFVDRHGRPVAYAFTFTETNGEISNDVYELNKAIDTLRDNPEIELIKSRWGNSLIHAIPDYNATEEKSDFLHVIWRPSADSWDVLMEKVGKLKNSDGTSVTRLRSDDLLSQFDILGLTAGGCRLDAPKSSAEQITSVPRGL